jgi:hypothetical protein
MKIYNSTINVSGKIKNTEELKEKIKAELNSNGDISKEKMEEIIADNIIVELDLEKTEPDA